MNSEISIDRAALPTSVREREQWVCWRDEERDGKPTKIPVTPRRGEFASSTDPATWDSFETALEYVETGNATGIGFVFTDDDPIVGIDLDDCRQPETGDVNDAALDIINRLDSYTEVSPSGTGYHVLITGDLPEGRNRRGNIELYDTARFFTVTGDHVEETPTRVARRQDALVAIHREYVQESETTTASEAGSGDAATESEATTAADVDVDLTDTELLEKAMNASNGEKFERLWKGHTAGYESQSEADMALCCLLAFWTGGDQTQMDQLFRQSGLLREKWDDVHYADGSTYGEMTIERAVATTPEFYDPAPDETTDSTTTTDRSPSDTGHAESDRKHAYLTEKARVLTERVDELETTLEQKNKRIATLETEVKQLTAELADRDSGHPHNAHSVTSSADDMETASVWTRTKRLFQGESE